MKVSTGTITFENKLAHLRKLNSTCSKLTTIHQRTSFPLVVYQGKAGSSGSSILSLTLFKIPTQHVVIFKSRWTFSELYYCCLYSNAPSPCCLYLGCTTPTPTLWFTITHSHILRDMYKNVHNSSVNTGRDDNNSTIYQQRMDKWIIV